MNTQNDVLIKNSEVLLKIAKDSIFESLTHHSLINKNKLLKKYPWLEEQRATFVTLNLDGKLRGCIGSLLPRTKLLEDIIFNAKAAAFEDFRFPSLTKVESEKIEIEISILTLPVLLQYNSIIEMKEKLRVGVDGVILKQGNSQATFLPQVWEQLPLFEDFFSHLCQKAGLEYKCLDKHPDIYIYQTLKVK